jgi:hypothetical protein
LKPVNTTGAAAPTNLHDQTHRQSRYEQDFIAAARDHEATRYAATSKYNFTDTVNTLIALGLVGASTAFGGYYAYRTGHATSEITAWAAVVMAVSLELAKPQCLAAALSAGRIVSHRVALGLLAFVACAYSLTAELSLVAMSRSDVTASRQQSINHTASAVRQRAALEKELDELVTEQPTAVAAKISKLISDNPRARCDLKPGDDDYGSQSKKVCPQIAALETERSAAERAQTRRVEITSILGSVADTGSDTNSEHAVTQADPGASALVAYLAVIGVSVKSEQVAEWLVLVPVTALEFGSLFAGLLVASTPSPLANSENDIVGRSVRAAPKIEVSDAAPNIDRVQSESPETLAANNKAQQSPTVLSALVPMVPLKARSANDAAQRLVEYVRQRGGVVQISTRVLAETLACKHGTLVDAVEALSATGVLTAEPKGRAGTVYRLATVSVGQAA